jgi:hypothetical protein
MARFIAVLLLILFSSTAFAQEKNTNGKYPERSLWEKNGIIVNDSQGRSIKQNSKVATLSDGTAVIVWEDERNGFSDIYAQKLDSSGMRLWGEKGVPVCKAPRIQTFPQVIAAGTNEVIVVWQDYRSESCDIYAQKLSRNGASVWTEGGVTVCTANTNQAAPQLATDGNGGAIIAWHDYRMGKGEDIFAQRIMADGTPAWTMNGLPICTEQSTQWYPQIVSDRNGGAILAWEDKRNGNYDIFAQRVDGSGKVFWQDGGIAISTAPENQQNPQIAECGDNCIAIVWQDYRNGNSDIYAQKVDKTGRTFWKNNGEQICNVAGNQDHPQISGGKDPVIVWADYRNGTGNSDIFAQKISEDGKLLWNLYGVGICESSGDQGNPKIASDGEGGAVVVWEDERSGTKGIFARQVSRDGKPQWAPDGKTICSTQYSAEFPQVAIMENGNAIYVWQDKRNGGLEVFSQSTNSLGVNVWKNNGIDIVFGFGSVSQQKPRLVRTGKNEYIVAFEDYRNGYASIFVQKMNNNGKLLWGRDAIRVAASSLNQLNPEIVSDDDGGVIIAWEDFRGEDQQIYAQRLDSLGNRLWDERGILICQTNKEKANPKICKDGKNGAIIVWQETRNEDSISRIFAQRVDGNGSILWKDDGLALSNSPGTQTGLKISTDGEMGAIITWVEYKGNINAPDIYAQRISGKGAVLWGPKSLAVCKAAEAQRNPELAVNNDIVIVWEDAGGGNYDIYAQKINKDGTIAWACDGVPVCTAAFTQHEPKLTVNDDGGATIVWEDYRKNNWDIYAQRISSEGGAVWDTDGVQVCTEKGTQYAPQIVKGKERSFLVVWEDYRNNKNYSIYAQKLSQNGEILWEPSGTAICITDGGSRYPQIVSDGEGGAIVVWTDFRFGTFDIYAQRIND